MDRIGNNMPDSKEMQIQKELNNLSKSIDSILKKIDIEREKLQPQPLKDDASGANKEDDNSPDNNSRKKADSG